MEREISIAFQTDKRAADYIRLAQLVNNYLFDAVTVYCDAPYHPSYMPLTLMAPHIERARIGPAAVPPSRVHPIDIAAQTALLSDLAAGGVYIGIARGAWLADHGIDEPSHAVQAIREAVEIVRYLLRGETGGYQGQVYALAEHVRAPYPLPETDIPLLVGTWGPKLCAVAGELADEVKIGGSTNPDVISHIKSYIAAGEEKAGREPGTVRIVIGAVTVVDEDREQARQAARRAVALYLPVVAALDPSIEVDPDWVRCLSEHANREEWDVAATMISDEMLDRFAFSGAPSDLIMQAERLFDAGAERIEFGTPHGLHQADHGIRLIGEQVLPALQ
ncbi:MAG: LLM class flavin-dependent oxidoreductase [Chloroflexota bacterium]